MQRSVVSLQGMTLQKEIKAQEEAITGLRTTVDELKAQLEKETKEFARQLSKMQVRVAMTQWSSLHSLLRIPCDFQRTLPVLNFPKTILLGPPTFHFHSPLCCAHVQACLSNIVSKMPV